MRIPSYLLAIGLLFQVVAAWAETAATAVFATGSPTVVAADGAVRGLARGGEVASGETVDTADGRVQLRFRDGASLSLQPATRFKIDDYHFAAEDGRAAPDSKGFFSLIKGGFRTISGLIGKGKREQYRVDTVVATIGIRGTEYGANLATDGLRVSTFAGLVEVCNDGGCQLVRPGETVLVEQRGRKPHLLNPGAALPTSADLLPQLQAPGQQGMPGGQGSGGGNPAPASGGMTTPGSTAAANATPPIGANGATGLAGPTATGATATGATATGATATGATATGATAAGVPSSALTGPSATGANGAITGGANGGTNSRSPGP